MAHPLDMIMGPVIRSAILLTVVISIKRTQITSLLLSQLGSEQLSSFSLQQFRAVTAKKS